MKTLEAIEDVCKALDRHCAGVEEAQRVLLLTQQFLALTVEIRQFDPSVTAKSAMEAARDRMWKIAGKDHSVLGGAPKTTGGAPVLPRSKTK